MERKQEFMPIREVKEKKKKSWKEVFKISGSRTCL